MKYEEMEGQDKHEGLKLAVDKRINSIQGKHNMKQKNNVENQMMPQSRGHQIYLDITPYSK